jgi:hypothetical protein
VAGRWLIRGLSLAGSWLVAAGDWSLAGWSLAGSWLAGGWLAGGWLAGWLVAGWLVAGWLVAGSWAGRSTDPAPGGNQPGPAAIPGGRTRAWGSAAGGA